MTGAAVTAADVVLMQGLARRVCALRPELVNPDATFGELAWVWGKDHGEYAASVWRRELWFADGGAGGGDGGGDGGGAGAGSELVGWAWAVLPHRIRRSDDSVQDVTGASLAFQVHPERPEVLDEVIAWFEALVPDLDRRVVVRAADRDAQTRWTAAGYGPDPRAAGDNGFWTMLNERALDDTAAPDLPAGFRFRTAAEFGPAAVAQAHIDAWHPSSYSHAAYEGVRRTASYREDLHILVEAPDGTLAASTIIWLDEVNRTAEFEPVGTHRGFRRLGLAEAMLSHGMRIVRDAGARHMTVACLGTPGNAALRLYEGIGFRELTRDVGLLKRAAG